MVLLNRFRRSPSTGYPRMDMPTNAKSVTQNGQKHLDHLPLEFTPTLLDDQTTIRKREQRYLNRLKLLGKTLLRGMKNNQSSARIVTSQKNML